MIWDPELYHRFRAERERPGEALIARLPPAGSEIRRVIDLGCGTGALTVKLQARFPAATVEGLDSSPEMLEKARALAPGLGWRAGAIEDFVAERNEDYDLIFSNAVLHWVADQSAIWPALMARLRRGGLLAVQAPLSSAPWRAAIAASYADQRWARQLAGSGPAEIPDPAALYALIEPEAKAIELWTTTYLHILPDLGTVVEWLKGAALRPALSRLEPDDARDFLAILAGHLRPLLPAIPGARVLFPFPRLFMLAERR